jgi:hypothetical protein
MKSVQLERKEETEKEYMYGYMDMNYKQKKRSSIDDLNHQWQF